MQTDWTSSERSVWRGRPSHWVKAPVYLLCLLTCWAVVPVYIFFNRFLAWHFTRYELTTERLHVTTGFLSKVTQDLELYRVRDITLLQPAALRLFSLGSIVLATADATTPGITIQAVRFPAWLRDQVRKYVEACRQAKGVRTVDVEQAAAAVSQDGQPPKP